MNLNDYEGMLTFGKKVLDRCPTVKGRRKIRKTNKSIQSKLLKELKNQEKEDD